MFSIFLRLLYFFIFYISFLNLHFVFPTNKELIIERFLSSKVNLTETQLSSFSIFFYLYFSLSLWLSSFQSIAKLNNERCRSKCNSKICIICIIYVLHLCIYVSFICNILSFQLFLQNSIVISYFDLRIERNCKSLNYFQVLFSTKYRHLNI